MGETLPAVVKDGAAQQNFDAILQRLCPAGGVMPFAGATAPGGWLLCDGSVKNRNRYPGLFDVLGTTYNTGGEASTDFRLPDYRDQFFVGAGSTYALGAAGGAATVALATGELPSHTHSDGTLAAASHFHDDGTFAAVDHTHAISANTAATGAAGANRLQALANGTAGDDDKVSAGSGTVDVTGNSGFAAPDVTGATGSTGSGTAHNNLPPYKAVNYIIRV